MNNYKSICILIGILCVCNVNSQIDNIESPCPQIFNYEASTSEYGKWYGTILISSQVTLYGFWIDIILDGEAESIGNWIGDVSTTNNMHFKIENKRHVINPFSSTSVRFFVKYNPLYSTPRVKYIRLNGQQICSSTNTEATTQISTSSTPVRRTSNQRNNGRYPTTMTSHVEALSLNNQKNSNNYNDNTNKRVHDIVTPRITREDESHNNNTNNYRTQSNPSSSDTRNRETSNSFTNTYNTNTNNDVSKENNREVEAHINNTNNYRTQSKPSSSETRNRETSFINYNTNTDVSSENNREQPNFQTNNQNRNTHVSNQTPNRDTSTNNNQHKNDRRTSQDANTQYSTADFESTTKRIYPSQSNRETQTSNYDYSNPSNSDGRVRPIIRDIYSRPNNFNDRQTSTTRKPTTKRFTFDRRDDDYTDSDSNKDDSKNNDYYESDFGLPTNAKISPTPLPINDNYEEKCGVVAAQPTPLIVGGIATSGGQWPWHVAIYQTQTVDSKYICGGSLISTSHVITAAHCVTRKSTSRKVNPQTLTVYLGKYNLRRSTDSVQIMLVRRIFTHPQYNSSNFYADLAVLKFTKPSDYTLHVRPVCLWKDTETDLSNIIDREGTVVGWGFDEDGRVTEDLTLVKMPVVKQSTCLWSFKEFYTHFTSEQSYCAGYENGTSVCNGDSGGGMVFPDNENSYSPIWRLRGLVSIGVAKQYEYRCDPYHYVVFTDVAQFLDWIKERLLE